ncbi:MAG TPA: hypothetical protein ENK62_03360 [Chromatiales bacterium]|nr:hypothetical protein [Chromatiales bacterium]
MTMRFDPPTNALERLVNEADRAHAVAAASGTLTCGLISVREGLVKLHRRLDVAVMTHCSCGGRGPDDPDACPACRVWHAVVGTRR